MFFNFNNVKKNKKWSYVYIKFFNIYVSGSIPVFIPKI